MLLCYRPLRSCVTLAGRHPPGRQTPQASRPTPTPRQADTPEGRPLQRTVRILLECILVFSFVLMQTVRSGSFTTLQDQCEKMTMCELLFIYAHLGLRGSEETQNRKRSSKRAPVLQFQLDTDALIAMIGLSESVSVMINSHLRFMRRELLRKLLAK